MTSLTQLLVDFEVECRKAFADDGPEGCNENCASCDLLIETEAEIRRSIADAARQFIAEDPDL